MAETKIQLAKYEDVTTVNTSLTTHKNDTSNPHSVTKDQVGLGNVLNVASYAKTETYTKTEVDNKIESENADWKANDENIQNDAIQREQTIVNNLENGTTIPLKANYLDNGGIFDVTDDGATTIENINMRVSRGIVNSENNGSPMGFGFNSKGNPTLFTPDYNLYIIPDFEETGDYTEVIFPKPGGTLALTSDIPSKTISQSNGYTIQGMQKAIDSGAGAGLQLWQSSALDSYVSLTSDSVKIKNPTKIELDAPTISSSGNIAINSQTAQFKAGSTEYNNGSIKFTNSSSITGSSSYELGVTIPGHKSSATAVYPGKLKLINKMTSSVDSGGTYTTTISLPQENVNLDFGSDIPAGSSTIVTKGTHYVDFYSLDYESDIKLDNNNYKLHINPERIFWGQSNPELYSKVLTLSRNGDMFMMDVHDYDEGDLTSIGDYCLTIGGDSNVIISGEETQISGNLQVEGELRVENDTNFYGDVYLRSGAQLVNYAQSGAHYYSTNVELPHHSSTIDSTILTTSNLIENEILFYYWSSSSLYEYIRVRYFSDRNPIATTLTGTNQCFTSVDSADPVSTLSTLINSRSLPVTQALFRYSYNKRSIQNGANPLLAFGASFASGAVVGEDSFYGEENLFIEAEGIPNSSGYYYPADGWYCGYPVIGVSVTLGQSDEPADDYYVVYLKDGKATTSVSFALRNDLVSIWTTRKVRERDAYM